MPKLTTLVIFSGWAAASLFVGSVMMVKHLIPLPATFTASGKESRAVRAPQKLIYLLAEGCGCSQIVAEYLVETGPRPNYEEEVWTIGDLGRWGRRLHERRFSIRPLRSEHDLERYSIQGAPMLIVTDTEGKITYRGGYAPRLLRNPDEVKVGSVLKSLRDGAVVEAFPVFGCAVGQNLRQILDPVGIL